MLLSGVQGITDLITIPGLINLDFADVKSIMQGAGSALMGIGSARGDDRAMRAAESAISSPLLEASIEGARGVLLSIAGGSDLGLFEINEAAKLVQEAVHEDANIIFGTIIDDALGDEVRVTVIAAGFDGGAPLPRRHAPRPATTGAPAAAPAPAESGESGGSAGAPRRPQPRRPRSRSRSRRRPSRRSSSTTPTTSTSRTSSSSARRRPGHRLRAGRVGPRRRGGLHRPARWRQRAPVRRRQPGDPRGRRPAPRRSEPSGRWPRGSARAGSPSCARCTAPRSPSWAQTPTVSRRLTRWSPQSRGVALAVLVADCVPVLLADAEAGVVAAVHAGRKGVALDVVARAVEAMGSLGARPERIRAALGPSICGRCYPLGEPARSDVLAVAPEAAATASGGEPSVDLRAGLLARLAALGVSAEVVGPCTAESSRALLLPARARHRTHRRGR